MNSINQRGYLIGLDIGGTNVRIGLVDASVGLHHFEIQKSEDLLDQDPVKKLAGFIQDYYQRCGVNQDQILGVCLGFPSTIDKKREVILSTPNIRGLDNIPLVKELGQLLGLPIFLERDVNLLLRYDIYYNQIDPGSTVLGFYLGTGFGNAIYQNGRIMTGKNGVAGELGHIPQMGDHGICTCGNEGCIENFASGKYLQTLRDQEFPDTPIQDLFVAHGDHPKMQEFVEALSIPVATEVNIFDPDHIIIGGGLLLMEGFPVEILEERILHHTRKPYPAENLSIFYARSNQENGVIGAGLHGFSCLEKK